MGTRTGNFRLGFRRGGGEWQKDLGRLAGWAKRAGFDGIDLLQATKADLATLKAAGLSVGSVDLLDWPPLLSSDPGKRKAAVEKNSAYLRELAEAGARAFFCCVIPEDPKKPRLENYKLAVESFGALGRVAAEAGARIVIEGWPGGEGLPNLACNPETVRALFKDAATEGLGVNYDPSHLIRMGIDEVRFIREFASRVGHVHAKDTEVFTEAAYEYGLYQPSVFQKAHRWGEHAWRYTLPGHGRARWTEIFRALEGAGFQGFVSVELEDENFNGTEAGEKRALEYSVQFLSSV